VVDLKSLALAPALAVSLLAQQPQPTIRGSWSATAGAQTFAGTWSGQLLPGRDDAGQGSWTVVAAGRVVVEGTWAAAKSPRLWQGRWSARIITGPSSSRVISGSWKRTVAASATGSFSDMLKQAIEQDITGSWRAATLAGAWRISASRN
jgi:hypothetical protein